MLQLTQTLLACDCLCDAKLKRGLELTGEMDITYYFSAMTLQEPASASWGVVALVGKLMTGYLSKQKALAPAKESFVAQ